MRYLLPLTLFLNSIISSQTARTFDDHAGLEEVFRNYIKAIDSKNIDSISRFFDYTDCTLHFGENKPMVVKSKEQLHNLLSSWAVSPKSFFVSTKLDDINIAPVWDDFNTKLCTVDATYSRIGNSNTILSKGRSLYHFYRDKNVYPYRLLKKWKKWKIYMITDLPIEDGVGLSD